MPAGIGNLILGISFNAECKKIKFVSDDTVEVNPELYENKHSVCRIRAWF